MIFRQLFDPDTATYTYLLGDPDSRAAILIDPVLEQVDRDLALIGELGLELRYAVETHVHADHVTGGGLLRERTGCKTGVARDGGASCADIQLADGDTVEAGGISLKVHATPGHTDGCLTYTLDDKMAFTGDALLIRGCGRTDFQQGDAGRLYDSIHKVIFSLPDACAIYPGHDYKGRMMSTVGEEKRFNPRLGSGRSREEFISIMQSLNLPTPRRIEEAVPANLACGSPSTVVQG